MTASVTTLPALLRDAEARALRERPMRWAVQLTRAFPLLATPLVPLATSILMQAALAQGLLERSAWLMLPLVGVPLAFFAGFYLLFHWRGIPSVMVWPGILLIVALVGGCVVLPRLEEPVGAAPATWQLLGWGILAGCTLACLLTAALAKWDVSRRAERALVPVLRGAVTAFSGARNVRAYRDARRPLFRPELRSAGGPSGSDDATYERHELSVGGELEGGVRFDLLFVARGHEGTMLSRGRTGTRSETRVYHESDRVDVRVTWPRAAFALHGPEVPAQQQQGWTYRLLAREDRLELLATRTSKARPPSASLRVVFDPFPLLTPLLARVRPLGLR